MYLYQNLYETLSLTIALMKVYSQLFIISRFIYIYKQYGYKYKYKLMINNYAEGS